MFTITFVMSDKILSLKSSCFEAFARHFESRIGNFARICRCSLLSKHRLHSTSECLNLSLSDKEPHLDCENVLRISVIVSLWRFSRDFVVLMIFFNVLDELSVFYIKFHKIIRLFILFKFKFKLPTLSFFFTLSNLLL